VIGKVYKILDTIDIIMCGDRAYDDVLIEQIRDNFRFTNNCVFIEKEVDDMISVSTVIEYNNDDVADVVYNAFNQAAIGICSFIDGYVYKALKDNKAVIFNYIITSETPFTGETEKDNGLNVTLKFKVSPF